TGGAGIQADIEAINSMGAHPAPVITAHTVQNTSDVLRFESSDPILLVEQARAILDDMKVAAFKLGMLGDVKIIEAVHTILNDYPELPVVFDPVLAAGGGNKLTDDENIDVIRSLILPLTTILTPNSIEARKLAPAADTLNACASALQDDGCEYVLITGAHEQDKDVVNRLYNNHRVMETFHWQRLEHEYHGSGCTLAASIAGLLAHGLEPFSAINEAQNYTWQSLASAYPLGQGQWIPNRFFWARDEDEN
ncbi:MAG: hydroxymethylpyrimidine/phosphomethylpyrimidine kinase, partial [Thioalkalispiraceae bacterium]